MLLFKFSNSGVEIVCIRLYVWISNFWKLLNWLIYCWLSNFILFYFIFELFAIFFRCANLIRFINIDIFDQIIIIIIFFIYVWLFADYFSKWRSIFWIFWPALFNQFLKGLFQWNILNKWSGNSPRVGSGYETESVKTLYLTIANE